MRIFSGLWGVTAPGDRIPAYRLSMATDLPGIGPLAAAWRDELAAVLDTRADGDLVVDCRSATYLSAWRPPRGATWVQVRVVRELAEGPLEAAPERASKLMLEFRSAMDGAKATA